MRKSFRKGGFRPKFHKKRFGKRLPSVWNSRGGIRL